MQLSCAKYRRTLRRTISHTFCVSRLESRANSFLRNATQSENRRSPHVTWPPGEQKRNTLPNTCRWSERVLRAKPRTLRRWRSYRLSNSGIEVILVSDWSIALLPPAGCRCEEVSQHYVNRCNRIRPYSIGSSNTTQHSPSVNILHPMCSLT